MGSLVQGTDRRVPAAPRVSVAACHVRRHGANGRGCASPGLSPGRGPSEQPGLAVVSGCSLSLALCATAPAAEMVSPVASPWGGGGWELLRPWQMGLELRRAPARVCAPAPWPCWTPHGSTPFAHRHCLLKALTENPTCQHGVHRGPPLCLDRQARLPLPGTPTSQYQPPTPRCPSAAPALPSPHPTCRLPLEWDHVPTASRILTSVLTLPEARHL